MRLKRVTDRKPGRALQWLVSLMLLSGLCACAGAPRSPGPLEPACFATHRVKAWYPVNRNVLRVNAGHAFFEVEISGPCPSAERRNQIVFQSDNGRICGRSWERVFVGGRQSCFVERVRPLSREQFYDSDGP